MNYIVLDMEWNQPSPGDVLIYENQYCLNNEIIQIGAVKLSSKLEIEDTFSINIKPTVYKKINYNVKKLTGIDEKTLSSAPSLAQAISLFSSWCGNDCIFLTWGYDDITVLGENLKYFGLDTSWLPVCYNVQMIFCAQTENENRQYSLTYAAEYFKLTLDKPLHNALTDAYYTALICSKLDLDKGISGYRAIVFKDKSIPEHMKNIIFKRAFKAIKGYKKIIELTAVNCPVCYECKNKLNVTNKAQNGPFIYLTIGECEDHGAFAQYVRINKTEEDTFCATQQYFSVDEYNREYFLTKVYKLNERHMKRKKRKESLQLNNK